MPDPPTPVAAPADPPAVSPETASAITNAVSAAITGSGIAAVRSSVEELEARWRTISPQLERSMHAPGGFWGSDSVFHCGVPRVARGPVTESVAARFHAVRTEGELFPGQNAAKSFRAYFLAAAARKQGSDVSAARIAADLYGESHPVATELHALADSQVITSTDRAGAAIPEAFLDGIVSLLRPRTVVLAAGPQMANMGEGGKLSIIVQSEGASFGYVPTETDPPTATSLRFVSRALRSKILKGMVVWSIAAMRRVSDLTDALVLNDLLAGAAAAMDDALLLSDGSSSRPKGIRHLVHPDHVIPATALTGGLDDAQRIRTVSSDGRKLKTKIADANIEPRRLVHFLSWRDFDWFAEQRTNDGAVAWPTVAENGTLSGFPMFWTTRIPTNGDPAGIGSTWFMIDMDHVVFAEEARLEVSVSFEATVTDADGGPFSLWERGAGAAMVTAFHDVSMTRPRAGAIATDVNYGGVDPT